VFYLATVGEGRAARHVNGDGARSVAEQRVDASSGEQELQTVECSPVVGTDAPAAPGCVRYRCIDTKAATSAAVDTTGQHCRPADMSAGHVGPRVTARVHGQCRQITRVDESSLITTSYSLIG